MKADRPGSRRFLSEILEWAGARDGDVPQKKQLVDYSAAELKDVQLSLRREHWGRAGQTIYVKAREYAVDTFGNIDAFLEHASRETGKPYTNLRAIKREAVAQASQLARDAPLPSEARARIDQDLARGKGWVLSSFQRDGEGQTRERLARLAKLLNALPANGEEPIRQYCASILRDSHALDDDESLRVAFENELEAMHPQADGTEAAYREAGLLERLAHGTVLIHGPLVLRVGEATLDLTSLATARTPIGLSESMLDRAEIVPPFPRGLITIENPTAWASLAREAPEDVVLVLTDGSPTRACQRLVTLAAKTRLPLLHWGDIDVGGLQILEHLQSLAPTKPLLMTTHDIEALREYLSPLKDAKRKRFESHRDRPEINASLEAGGWLEQETIPVHIVLEAVETSLREHA